MDGRGQKRQGQKAGGAHPAGGERQRQGEEGRLQHEAGEEVGGGGRGGQMQGVVEEALPQGIDVEEGRPGMVEIKAGVIAVDFPEMLGLVDLQGVYRKVAQLVERGREIQPRVHRRPEQDDGEKNRPAGLEAEPVHGLAAAHCHTATSSSCATCRHRPGSWPNSGMESKRKTTA